MVRWSRPTRPGWMDRATYDRIPGEMELREIRVRVDRPGFRVEESALVTTLLDEVVYTKEELAGLYLNRRNIGPDLRPIKIDMQMDVLRCLTAEGVVKEIWMHAPAYDLVRGVIAAAAEEHGEEPRSSSFKGALQALESFREEVGRAGPAGRARLVAATLKTIASRRVGDRPARVEPRAIKRRPKPHRLLKEPRRGARQAVGAQDLTARPRLIRRHSGLTPTPPRNDPRRDGRPAGSPPAQGSASNLRRPARPVWPRNSRPFLSPIQDGSQYYI